MPSFNKGNIRGGKVTPMEVLWIREAYDRRELNQRQLAERFNVSRETIARIVRGETWKQFAGPGTDRPTVDQNQIEEALEDIAIRTAPALESAEIQASLAKLAKLGIVGKPLEDSEDVLPRQTNDVLPPDGSRLERATDRPSAELPVRDLPVDQCSEGQEPVAGRLPGTGPGR